jgi:poly(A) polymerase
MNLVLDGVELDILFARLSLSSVPKNLSLADDKILLNLDEPSVHDSSGFAFLFLYFFSFFFFFFFSFYIPDSVSKIFQVRSLNGVRVNDLIVNLVPNMTNFQMSARFIKLWAKKRGVYSNKLGYPGGVAWVMLTARVCQLYPNSVSIRI